jgi:hypothetical protein
MPCSEGSGGQKRAEEGSVPSFLAAGFAFDRDSVGELEMALDRRPSPHGGRALVGP